MSTRLRAPLVLALVLSGSAVSGAPVATGSTVAGSTMASSTVAGSTVAGSADFNGDGHADLAVGALRIEVDGIPQAGGIHVLLGTATGLSGVGSSLLTRSTAGIPQDPEDYEWWGTHLAWGDFNADGFDDLAVSAPYGNVGDDVAVGSVTVIPGSAAGLTGKGSTLWGESSKGVPGRPASGDLFGRTIAAADFDGDGDGDLAIGVPHDGDRGGGGGTVRLLYGSSLGLGGTRVAERLRPKAVQAPDAFGNALAAGDFDGDGRPELAVGAPDRTVRDQVSAGVVSVFAAGPDGLERHPYETWSAKSPGLQHGPGFHDNFGGGLRTGDLDADGRDDLVAAGVGGNYVRVLFAGTSGLTGVGSQYWDRAAIGFPVEPPVTTGFGLDMAVADVTADGFLDLVIGDYAQAINGHNGGLFYVLHGSGDGPTVADAERWHQDSPGIGDEVEHLEYFGGALVASDVDRDGLNDVITSIWQETIEDGTAAGMVQIFFRSADGTTFTHDQRITQLSDGIQGDPQWPDSFGFELAG